VVRARTGQPGSRVFPLGHVRGLLKGRARGHYVPVSGQTRVQIVRESREG